MAKCTNCGNTLKEGTKFCASCGTPVKGSSAKSAKSAKETPTEEARSKKVTPTGGPGSMGKLALLIVRIACIAILVCFFLPYYSMLSYNVSGVTSALGLDKRISVYSGYSVKVPITARPALLFVPLIALAVLAVLQLPKIRGKVESINVPLENVPVIGEMGNFSYVCIIAGLFGLIFLGANNARGYAAIGFILSVIAYIAILAMPFVDKFLLSKNR